MSTSHYPLTTIRSRSFPPLLREIADPPKQLYLKGTYPDSSLKFLTVVGSRTYSAYGRQTCEMLIRGLAGYPIVIISGLALGIDGIAHRAALDAGLLTVAVPGSGLDDAILHPSSHRTLAHDILDAGGALVSELSPTERAQVWTFPRRNRIMVGLSHAVLVIEAELKSGTLITARLAADYCRDVLAVPGPIQSVTSQGPHMLIKKGAALIETSADILEALGISADVERQPALRFDLSTDEQRVLTLLKEPLPRDELVRQLGRSASEASILLSSLELKGAISERLGYIARI